MKTFHRFAFSAPIKEGEEAKPFKTRDGAAFGEVTAPLPKLGYEYGSLIFNYPFDRKKDSKLGRDHFKFLAPQDLLVLTTRPPLHDELHGDKKIVKRSHTDLEDKIFDELRRFFEVCARSHVKLTKDMAEQLKDKTKADMKFHQHKDARLVEYMALDQFRHARVPEEEHVTIAFFVHVKSIGTYGCELIASFGMGGIETLIWNRIVRTRHASWLSKPVFAVGQLDLKNAPVKPTTLDFVDQIEAQILLERLL